MALSAQAVHKLLPENATQGSISPTQIILHTAVDAPGPTSLYGFFARGDVNVESHFFIKLNGEIEQYIDTTVRADANREANKTAISIETEDDGDGRPWTPDQLGSILMLLDELFTLHPRIQRRVCPAWNQSGVGYHSMWGAPSPWTPAAGKTCPGRVRIAQFDTIIAPWLENTDDMPYSVVELQNILRSVLDEGTAPGFQGWASTNRGQIELSRAIHIAVAGGIDVDRIISGIAERIPEANREVVREAVEDVFARAAGVDGPSSG